MHVHLVRVVMMKAVYVLAGGEEEPSFWMAKLAIGLSPIVCICVRRDERG